MGTLADNVEQHRQGDRRSFLPLELLRSGVTVRLRVTGKSMAPYLADNDLVTVEPVAASALRLGDLVYTHQPGLPPLLHRVIQRVRGEDGGWSVRTKGDANVTGDPTLPVAHVAGRVVSIGRLLPSGRRREVRLQTPRHRLLQCGLALGSRHAPRPFAAISRRLAPPLLRLSGWVRWWPQVGR